MRHSENVLIMMRLLLILILMFSFQTLTKADDIRDFQIEGMSIGDSALNYYSKEFIKSSSKYTCNNSEFTNCEMFIALMGPKGIYTGDIQLVFKKNDLNYKIYSITGTIRYINDIENCYPKQKKISLELQSLFPKAKKEENMGPHTADKTGKSTGNNIYFLFPEKDAVYVSCYDWSKEMKYNDHLRISIRSSEYRNWVNNKAYN